MIFHSTWTKTELNMEADKESQLMTFKEKVIDRYKVTDIHVNHVLLTIAFTVFTVILRVSQLHVTTASAPL